MLESIHPKNSKATKRNFSLFLRLVRVRARIPIVRESGYSIEIERVTCHDGHHLRARSPDLGSWTLDCVRSPIASERWPVRKFTGPEPTFPVPIFGSNVLRLLYPSWS
jgi:hypothetical protein